LTRLKRFLHHQIAHVKRLPDVQGNDLIFLVLERSATSTLQLDPATYDRFSEIFTGINPSKALSATAWMIDDEVTISASESANEQSHGPSLIESADEQFHQPSSTVRQTVAKGMKDLVGVRARAQACSQRAADIGSLGNSGPADRADEDAESDSEVEPAPTTGNRKRASPKKVLEPRKRHAAMKMRAQAREQLAAVIDLDSASEHSSFAASAHKGADSEDEAELASTTGKRKRVDEQETTEALRPRKNVKKARNATAPAPPPVTQPAQPVPVPQPVVVPLPAGPQAADPPPAVPQPATIP
jgi:hypothetical protein